MSLEVINGHLYDYPKYYDLVFGSDWKAEFDFVQDCCKKFVKKPVKRIFEPACGTGRLMYKLADAGFEVAGNDLNPKAVEFCNKRLEKRGHAPTAEVGDMSDFTVKKKFDAAFNMINSFRHLTTEKQAVGHLKCVAEAIKQGGIFILGLHLNPADVGDDYEAEEEWSARRGHLQVNTRLWSMEYHPKTRTELIGFTYDVYTPSKQFRIEDTTTFRCYTRKHMQQLIKKVPEWELVETYDFHYDIDDPIVVDDDTEDVVYILRKK
ncbi:class I SAM-dependent methyltransferase [Rubinisphaera sp.]|uniref:dTDP-3-amino-3,4, 6-trideoxy-alpha-D-glucopyranose n=1 Tax=Rubinisphaera italica TaxID=2527969 RepID=A0A5C5XJX8_9PLAN|nr:class I SAM-dependent methyltransferase [Rubinisphaera sp.]TWT62663.1 dTDP-3-amino-3,4,6-trideoxy-alpha-D-glucopyranose [Rubinisphaera italica]